MISKKWLKWFVLAFAGGLFLPQVSGNAFKADLSNNIYEEYYKNADLGEVVVDYHRATNELVNQYLETLLKGDQSKVGFVLEDQKCEFLVNVSTYCLAVVLNENLVQFNEFLETHKDDFSKGDEDEDPGPITLNDAFEYAALQTSGIENQMNVAEDAFDLTLSVYNQAQLVKPLHDELKKLLAQLEDYRDNIAAVRDVVELYPSKFNGASTLQCK